MTIYHDGTKIPTASPKDLNADIERGFKYPLEVGETILSSQWFINETLAIPGNIIDGLRIKSQYYVDNITKLSLAEGILNKTYFITNRVQTTRVVQDDRSFYIKVVKL